MAFMPRDPYKILVVICVNIRTDTQNKTQFQYGEVRLAIEVFSICNWVL